MTQQRDYGTDSPLSQWIRGNNNLDSIVYGLTLNDTDWTWHKYKAHVDGIGTRSVQLSMSLEEKCRNGMPDDGQTEILFYNHQLLKQKKRLLSTLQNKMVSVWHFGVYVISYPGMDIHPLINLSWYYFNQKGHLVKNPINLDGLTKLLRFEVAPDTLKPFSLRRHHKTKELIINEEYPLGFSHPRRVIDRS